MKAEYCDDYKCLFVNTHKTQTVISDFHIGLIKSIEDVHSVSRFGSYGMELFIIHDSNDQSHIRGKVEKILIWKN